MSIIPFADFIAAINIVAVGALGRCGAHGGLVQTNIAMDNITHLFGLITNQCEAQKSPVIIFIICFKCAHLIS